MEDAQDMFNVFWGDAQMMPEVSDSTFSEGGPVGPAVVEADDDARLQTQSPCLLESCPWDNRQELLSRGHRQGPALRRDRQYRAQGLLRRSMS